MEHWHTTARTILTRLLLGFALISIGFAAGRHAVKSTHLPQPTERPVGAVVLHRGPTVVVYYMHATFRCVTCNTIEKMTRDLLESTFAPELKSGTVRMVEVDFQENEALAKRYEVAASCVVVTQVHDREEIAYQRLDDVWTRMEDPPGFNRYVGDTIRAYLTAGEAEP